MLFVLMFSSTESIAQTHFQPVNPNATPEAKALLERLYATVDSGKIISGLHHNMLDMPYYANDLVRIDRASGKTPMIWGGDLAWDADTVVELATQQYHAGHIVTLMWHAGRPFDKGRVDFRHQTSGPFTDKQWKELVTEGSEMHRMWIAQVDSISEYLKTLQERHIPVIWRPLHEMNGEWFWWGNRAGKKGYQKLWRMLYDRMTSYHHLNNLIWVWNANAVRETPGDRAMKLDDYFPGIDCVDVLATDVYHRDWRQCHHDDLAKLAQGKLIALGELGSLPTPEILKNMPKFAWFMIWTGFTKDEFNTADELNAIFSLPNVINYEGKMIDKEQQTDSSIVRLSYIEIYPEYHDAYMKMALEVGAKSMQTEPGVIAMYPMGVKKDENALYILEIYSSQEAYKKHIASAHFQKYKQGTLHMVKHLDLIDTNPLNPLMSIKSEIKL